MSSESRFQARVDLFRSDLGQVESRLAQIAWLRLLVFVGGGSLEVYSWKWGEGWWILALIPLLAGFGVLVKWNQRVELRKQFLLRLIKINQNEPMRLAGIDPDGDGGLGFTDKEHPYCNDLDLFGKKSLFSLLDRSATSMGHEQLAQWLLDPAQGEVIRLRQLATAELAAKVDFRQNLQAEGQFVEKQQIHPAKFQEWLNTPSELAGHAFLPGISMALTIGLIGCMVATIVGWIPWWVVSAWFGLHFVGNRVIFKILRKEYLQTEVYSKVLRAYANLLERISEESIEAEYLRQLQGRLQTEGRPAAEEIRALAKILERLELHMNAIIHFVLNNLFFWDIHALSALDKWKRAHAGKVLGWFEVIGEMEAISGIAALQFGAVDWAVPEIKAGSFHFQAEEAGHPLIPFEARVSNPVELPVQGFAWLITGSNMSGKSTYLRTVGVNALLAMIGAPVCAKRMVISPMQIATSMRVADSLEENTSSFYAELKRLKQVIHLVSSGKPTLFLLDEILKGTNSQDRHAGARALIRQLVLEGGTGLVSTHDLELQDLAMEMNQKVVNMSFHCDVGEDGRLTFDYRLRTGVCQSMNATALMRAMGIEM